MQDDNAFILNFIQKHMLMHCDVINFDDPENRITLREIYIDTLKNDGYKI